MNGDKKRKQTMEDVRKKVIESIKKADKWMVLTGEKDSHEGTTSVVGNPIHLTNMIVSSMVGDRKFEKLIKMSILFADMVTKP